MKIEKQAQTQNVVPFNQRAARDVGAEHDEPVAMALPAAKAPAPVVQGADLSGYAKIVCLIGRGRTGKTMCGRWIGERAQRAGTPLLFADLDPTNASFSSYFDGVSRPDSDSPQAARAFLGDFLEYATENRISAVIDLGGGDTSLRTLAEDVPGLIDVMTDARVALVTMFFAGPSPDDLAPMLALEARGFIPSARAVVLNEGLGDYGISRDQAFARVTRSRAFAQATAAGAVPVWMPRLSGADAIEKRRLSFAKAAAGAEGLGIQGRLQAQRWLAAMEAQFKGIETWLP